MDDLFESPRLLFESTEVSLSEFESLAKGFRDTCQYTVVRHLDPKTGENVIRLRLNARIPGSARILANRIIGDLKHALDQCVCDCALLTGRPDARGIHFPIGKSVDDFELEIKRRLKHVHPDIVNHIRNLDTNERGNPFLYSFLALAGPGKHQRIVSLGVDAKHTIIDGNSIKARGPFKIGINKWNASKNEIEFARIGNGGHLEGDFKIPIQIALYDGSAPFSGNGSADLRKAKAEVGVIINNLETLAKKLIS